MKLLLLCLLVPAVVQGHRNVMKVDTREIEEDCAKNSILMYDPDIVEDIKELEAEIQKICKCKIEHLPSIQSFILHYKDSTHLPASTFSSLPGIIFSNEDEIIMPPDDEIEDADDERMAMDTERQGNNPVNDPNLGIQWALGDLSNNADINWREGLAKYLADSQGGSSSGPSVVVAVIDTGIDYNHPDLKNEMWTNPGEIAGNGIDDDGNGIVDDVYGANFVTETGNTKGDPMDRDVGTRGYGHGTHCAGVIAATANNGAGIAGIAGQSKGKVKLMAVRSLGSQGGAFSWLLNGLNYAISKGAKISSNSWGGRSSAGVSEFTKVLQKHTEHLFISAAGNENAQVTSAFVPCAVATPNAICVASSTSSDAKSSFSNYNTATGSFVHVFAPGSRIYSTYPKSQYKYMSGTSMACPQVSGLAALVMSMRGNLTPAQVKQLIEQNVQKKSQYTGKVSTGGLIDVDKTISAITGNNGGATTQKPDTNLCVNIIVKTLSYGIENSWKFGSCSGPAQGSTYASYKTYSGKCCQPAGTYELECKDSYGDGWHGGWIKIGATKTEICKNFRNGSSQKQQVEHKA